LTASKPKADITNPRSALQFKCEIKACNATVPCQAVGTLTLNKRCRRLLGRPRCTPVHGHTSSVPRHGLRGVGCLKQLPKPVFQEFDGFLQGAELSNPDYRDGSVQLKRWGTQYFHAIDGTIPGNKASG
jgi:hypothetical protein